MDPVIQDDVDHFEVGFEHFKLRPGLELELQGAAGKPLPHRAQFVMAYPGKGVLVSLQAGDPSNIALEPGTPCRVSGFNGKFDFFFDTRVRKVDPIQFTAMLASPASITVRFVRKYPRMDLALPGTVSSPRGSGGSDVTIRNLSIGGAAISSVQPLGGRGEPLLLHLQVMFENRREPIRLSTVVRRSGMAGESLMYDTGVEFVNPTRMDKLLLHYYLNTLAREYAVI